MGPSFIVGEIVKWYSRSEKCHVTQNSTPRYLPTINEKNIMSTWKRVRECASSQKAVAWAGDTAPCRCLILLLLFPDDEPRAESFGHCGHLAPSL